ncbi:MAG: signal peptide peptidase SppA [Rhodospirillales bacterium]|nr:signal peptide peptidase SppA [Rhodospirillales bacterium]
MAQDAEALIERQRLCRRLMLWRLLFVGALALAAIVAFAKIGDDEPTGAYVAVLDVNGVIETDRDRDDALDRIARDDNAKALLLRINSSGGTFVGGENLYLNLVRVADAKPVVVVMEDVATSAGYMIAMASERIFVRQGTITGSIGVIFPTTEVVDFFDILGISFENIKSDPLKANPSPLERTLPEAREWTQIMVDEMQAVFVSIVDEGRPDLDHAAVVALADGRVFSGVRAVENGLVDEFGGDREARDWLAAEHDIATDLPLRDVEIEDDLPWYAEVLWETGKSVLPEPLILDGMLALWHPEL